MIPSLSLLLREGTGGTITVAGLGVNFEWTVLEAEAALFRARDLVELVSLTGEGGDLETELRRLRTGEEGEEEAERRRGWVLGRRGGEVEGEVRRWRDEDSCRG